MGCEQPMAGSGLGRRQPRDARCLGSSQGSHAQRLASAQPQISNDGKISFSAAALAQPMDSDQSKKHTLKCTQRFSSPNPHRQTNPSAGELRLQPDSESPWAGLGMRPGARADAGTPRQGPVPRRREVTPRGKATPSHRPRQRALVPPPSSPFPKQFPNQTFLSGVY